MKIQVSDLHQEFGFMDIAFSKAGVVVLLVMLTLGPKETFVKLLTVIVKASFT
jgi:hypothetical protein